MKLQQYVVNAFASQPFAGNPAAICPLEAWLDDAKLQAIAAQNNLSETAFFVPLPNGRYHLRWFTPSAEVPLCGHATLASGYVLHSFIDAEATNYHFDTLSGPLSVSLSNDRYTLDFPAQPPTPCAPPYGLIEAVGANPSSCLRSAYYMLVFDSQRIIENIEPDLRALAAFPDGMVIVTAPGDTHDFVSRFFAPAFGIDEDPVTGSAHTHLTPYWAKRLKKTKLTARQLSPRGGDLWCETEKDRVKISGHVQLFSESTLHL